MLFASTSTYADHHTAEDESHTTTAANLRFFKKAGTKTYMAEFGTGTSYKDQPTKYLKFGSYFKLKDGRKIGAFVSVNSGLRHTNDWIKSGHDWIWQDTSSRSETLFHLNFSQRYVPQFDLPLVFEIKTEYQYNTFNNQQLIILKPGMNYFYLVEGRPRYSFHLGVPLYIPMNFEKNTIYKTGMYFGLMYHHDPTLQFGVSLESRTETWTESDEFQEAKPDDSYEADDRISHLKFEIIHQF
jgi:hypothetical protein